MERQRRSASKITDYRKYHLSGDLDKVVQGKVTETVKHLKKFSNMSSSSIDENASPEELQELVNEQKENSSKLQQQVTAMKLRNELEAEKMQQEQWELVIQQLKQTRDQMAQQHEENMDKIKSMAQKATQPSSNQAVAWMEAQLKAQGTEGAPPHHITSPPVREEPTPKQLLLQQLLKQQQELQKKIEEVSAEEEGSAPNMMEALLGHNKKSEQELLMEQIRATLAPRSADVDPNKALLKALLTSHNKTTGMVGTSMLKTDVLHKLTGEAEFSMAEWLASLNKQEEGESEVNRILTRTDDEFDCRSECKHTNMRSGMLDKATTNIRHKEVWPQKNLGEDWAEEEMI